MAAPLSSYAAAPTAACIFFCSPRICAAAPHNSYSAFSITTSTTMMPCAHACFLMVTPWQQPPRFPLPSALTPCP